MACRRVGQPIPKSLRPRRLLDAIAKLALPPRTRRAGWLLFARRRPEQRPIKMESSQALRTLRAHEQAYPRPPVPALRDISVVAEARHQRVPRRGDALHAPAGMRRLVRKAVTRQRRRYDVKGVLRLAAEGCRIGERRNDFVKFDDRSRPAVGEDDRQRVRVFRPRMDEVDVQAVDLGAELREGINPRFALAPIISVAPIGHQRLKPRERHTLGPIIYRLAFRPPRCREAAFEVIKFGLRHGDGKGCDEAQSRTCRCAHG